jgi:hypothetical protein
MRVKISKKTVDALPIGGSLADTEIRGSGHAGCCLAR